ncbi:helix-turn-helix domain-containing protein [Pseudoalteromonas sp. G4]|uniref:helix-turn-helix domain-containing protein n=1 Tax=Pseudoalteromonas sp. G4 TaxID=2992761 RepID=UPI00237E2523|nr:helix-turn-helix domain-containing protein [Pseudoalteromonas sp. G4]
MNMTKIALNGPRVAVVAYDRLCQFEFGIAVEIFGLSRPEFGGDWYQFDIVSAEESAISGLGGITYQIDKGLEALAEADIIILPGWREPYIDVPSNLLKALLKAYKNKARLVAICGGAYILAATGLLKNKKATTHWMFLENFKKEYPEIDISEAPLFCEEDNLYTSAGSAAGIDLCLHIVQQDYGLTKANEVAKRLVVAPLRSGNATQDVAQPVLPQNKHQKLPDILNQIKSNLLSHPTIEEAAQKANLSPRTFTRQFQKIVGMTYGDWIRDLKLEQAKSMLKETDLSIEIIAEACGYASSSSLRRLFQEKQLTTPLQYRKTIKGLE